MPAQVENPECISAPFKPSKIKSNKIDRGTIAPWIRGSRALANTIDGKCISMMFQKLWLMLSMPSTITAIFSFFFPHVKQDYSFE